MTRNDLGVLRPEDLANLLASDPTALLGRILLLNRAPFYHNALNAVVVAWEVMELQRRTEKRTSGHRSTRSVAADSRLVRKEWEGGEGNL